jgi:hypothetical protein
MWIYVIIFAVMRFCGQKENIPNTFRENVTRLILTEIQVTQ